MHWLVIAALGVGYYLWKKSQEVVPIPGGFEELPEEPEPPREPRPDLVVELSGDEWTEVLNSMALCRLNTPDLNPEEAALCALREQESGFPWPAIEGDHPTTIEVWNDAVRLGMTGGPHAPSPGGLAGG